MMTRPAQLALPIGAGLSDVLRAELAGRVELGWQHQAACAGRELDLWVPDAEDDPTIVKQARRICRTCPVLASCRAAGILGDEHGTWGATTRTERRVLVDQLTYGLPVGTVLDPAHPIPATKQAGVAA